MKKICLEIDQMIVPLSLLWQARSGVASARQALSVWCKDKELKSGFYDISDDEAAVGVVELAKMGVVKGIKIETT